MPAIELTPAERKEQRAQAHHLDPVVMIGSDGLTLTVRKEIDLALNSHGLIKVRVLSDDREYRNTMFAALADEFSAAPIQHIGKLLVFWRPIPPREKAEPQDRNPGPREVKIVRFSKSGNHRPQIKRVTLLGNQRVAAGGEIKRTKRRVTSVKKSSQQP